MVENGNRTFCFKSASEKKTKVEEFSSQLASKESIAVERKTAVDRKLDRVRPALEEAQKAVSNINSAAIAEIKSMKAPPEVLTRVMTGVLMVLGRHDTSWDAIKRFKPMTFMC